MKLFLFEKCAGDPVKSIGTILFVHGSSMASQPTFDLQVPARPDSSAMDHFARCGYDCWSVDMESYGRSTKDRDNNAPISQGAEPVTMTQPEFKAFMDAQIAKWADVIKANQIPAIN